MVQAVPQEVGACATAMSVKYPKERAPRPRSTLLVVRLHNIKDDRDPVLVVGANKSLVCVGCVSTDHTVAFDGGLTGLVGDVLGQDNLASRLERFVCILGDRTAWLLVTAAGTAVVVGSFDVLDGRGCAHVAA